ncbi:toxin secretion/phage lysis holin [Clostridium sp. CAG:253]|nr:toxin secretion/phage lysis holin [Clostridium sp. CAG:253]
MPKKAGKDKEMDKIQIYATQLGLSTIIAAISSECGLLGWLLLAVTIAMVIDFAAGMAASAKEAVEHPNDKEYGWNSKKGMIGIFKKVGYILVIFTAMIVDFIIYELSGYLDMHLPMNTFFSTLVTAWFILNECLSITENAGRMGVAVPVFLTKIIAVLKGTVEEKADILKDKEESEDKDYE